MASKILRRIYLTRVYGNFYGKVSREKMKINFLSFQLCHSQSSTLNDETDITSLVEVQKFLSFIQADSSYLQKMETISNDKLNATIHLVNEKSKLEAEVKNLLNMSTEGDKELEKLINEEKDKYLNSIKDLNMKILENTLLLNNDNNDDRSVEIQFFPGIGGLESKLFTEEIFNMYLKYADYKNWECSVVELKGDKSDIKGGFIFMSGKDVYGWMQHEGGVHRVQRVPETEKAGRVHTSTCVVVVLAQPKLSEVNISPKDLEIKKTTSSGPGGQNVNKNETCVRLKHLPTGIVVECQESRYQESNKKIAMERLRRKLFELEQNKVSSERHVLKKKQFGLKDYTSKIRTYNFIQNRVTDHRINYSVYNLPTILEGGKELDGMVSKVREASKKQQVLDSIERIFQSVDYKNYLKKNECEVISLGEKSCNG